jgi:hypothetical protein
VDPVPDPLLLRKCGTAGNRIRTSGSVARNILTVGHRGGHAMGIEVKNKGGERKKGGKQRKREQEEESVRRKILS